MQNLGPDDWKQLFALLDVGLELSAQQRTNWLESLTAVPDRLRQALQEMLQWNARERSHTPPTNLSRFTGAADQASASGQALKPGDIIGAYRVLQELGRGGMSSVWVAERADGLIKRQVALKLPHLTWVAPDLGARMCRERDILAMLQHPNIARLYDAGVDHNERPYLALELIDGQSLEAYCREHHCGIKARLSIVLRVARAVAYAHSQLVVHRDLKPSNILIDKAGEVHLLDFGVAKLLHMHPQAASASTQFEIRAITPDYASPEQILGEATSTGTDIYSLGVILYELLAGHLPYDVGTEFMTQAHTIARLEAPAPSSIVKDRAVARMLRGDLDTVVLKAIKKDSTDRYSTMAAFADDIERILHNQPILARRDSKWLQVWRFSRRNRLMLQAAAALLLVLATGLLAAWQAKIAHREHLHADNLRTFARVAPRILDPLITLSPEVAVKNILLIIGPSVGSYRQQLHPESGVPSWSNGLLSLIKETWGGDSPQYSQVLAEVASMQIINGLLRNPRDERLLLKGEHELEHALILMRKFMGSDSPAVAAIMERITWLHWSIDDFSKAEKINSEIISIYEMSMHPRLGRAQALQGEILSRLGRTAEAEIFLQAALTEGTSKLEGEQFSLSDDMMGLAITQYMQGEYRTAEQLARQGLDIISRKIGDRPANLQIGYANTVLAIVLMKINRLGEAESWLRKSLLVYEEIVARDHPYVISSEHLLGEVLFRRGEISAAKHMLQSAIERCRRSGCPAWMVSRSQSVMGEALYSEGAIELGVALIRNSCRALKSDAQAPIYSRKDAAVRLSSIAGEVC